jgi:methylated-DNA-protein-cysteine methyltransferase related protein
VTRRDRILDAARRIPFGKVATYGDVAAAAGIPGAAREVGWAMSSLPDDSDVPWWRVVNAAGRLSPRAHGTEHQEMRLREEAVPLDSTGRLDLRRHRWEGPADEEA